MPTESEHLKLARTHLCALVQLLPRPEAYAEWIVTTAFYTALQVVEAVFQNHLGHGCKRHDDRRDLLRSNQIFLHLHTHYRPLYEESRTARYDPAGLNIAQESVVSEFVEYRLTEVLMTSRQFLSEQGQETVLTFLAVVKKATTEFKEAQRAKPT